MPKIQTPSESSKFDLPARSNMVSMRHLPWLLLLAVILVGAVYAYHQQRQTESFQQQLADLKANPQKVTEEETKALLDKVGMLIELPDEQPTVATVSDLAPLKEQPFFANAQIGDKVLIFSTAKKAVLYRPSTNKVIEVAPVNLDAPAANVNTTTKASTPKSTRGPVNTNSNEDTTSSDEGN